jgi:DNA anti-recombination protein RmuC
MKEWKADAKEWKADAKEWKAEMEKDMNTLKTGVKESDMERKDFQRDIVQKLDTIRTEFTQSQKDLTSTFLQSQKDLAKDIAFTTEKQLAAYGLDQQKQISNLYFRSLFTVSLTLYVIY